MVYSLWLHYKVLSFIKRISLKKVINGAPLLDETSVIDRVNRCMQDFLAVLHCSVYPNTKNLDHFLHQSRNNPITCHVRNDIGVYLRCPTFGPSHSLIPTFSTGGLLPTKKKIRMRFVTVTDFHVQTQAAFDSTLPTSGLKEFVCSGKVDKPVLRVLLVPDHDGSDEGDAKKKKDGGQPQKSFFVSRPTENADWISDVIETWNGHHVSAISAKV